MSRRPALVVALALLTEASFVSPAAAQEIGVGADFVSRYVWRGFDFGQSASIQPTIELSSGDFTLGTWGSFAITDAGANELDLYASYAFGPLSVGVTDYYFPTTGPDFGEDSGSDFFNYRDGGDGSHYIEPFVSYEGDETFPLTITLATLLYNDPEFSTYVEAGYGVAVGETELGVAVGSVLVLDSDGVDGSSFYGTSRDVTVSNISLSAGREIPITDRFSLPIFGQLILNPETDRAFLVFGVSL